MVSGSIWLKLNKTLVTLRSENMANVWAAAFLPIRDGKTLGSGSRRSVFDVDYQRNIEFPKQEIISRKMFVWLVATGCDSHRVLSDNIQAVNAINLGGPWENWFLSRHLWDTAKLLIWGPDAGNDDKCHIMTTVHWYLGIVAHTSQLSFYQDSLLDTWSWRSSNNSLAFLQTGPIRRQVKMLQLIQCQAMASL